MTINTNPSIMCSKKIIDSLCTDRNSSNQDCSILKPCSEIQKRHHPPPLSDNTKNCNWVRITEYTSNKKNNTELKNRQLCVESNYRVSRRRMKMSANPTPLRQICKNNRDRSELLAIFDLKVLHSSIGRIFVTLSALAFVTIVAGSPSSYGNSMSKYIN